MNVKKQSNYILSDDLLISERIFHILGKKWSLPVIKKLAKYEILRFNQIKNNFQKITPTTLSSILKELEKHGIIKKKIHDGYLPTVSYLLTDYGKSLYKISLMLETLSHNFKLSNLIKGNNTEKTSVVKNFSTDKLIQLKNEVRQHLIPLATLASVGIGMCSIHGIKHLEHINQFF